MRQHPRSSESSPPAPNLRGETADSIHDHEAPSSPSPYGWKVNLTRYDLETYLEYIKRLLQPSVSYLFLSTRRDEDYERTFGGKTIAAGLTIRVTPTDDLSSAPEVQVSPEVEAGLVKDEVCVRYRVGDANYKCVVGA